jgi:hypothetical protein
MALTFDESIETPQGAAMAEELRWVHGIIRSNLQTISNLVAQLYNGASAEQIRAQINELAANSALWTLRVNCFRYCDLVHTHHKIEDVALFPRLRRFHPALTPVVDKLEADHVVVSNYLDEVEAVAERLTSDEGARAQLAEALRNLADHLLTHLDYEETNIAPTLRRMSDWFGE